MSDVTDVHELAAAYSLDALDEEDRARFDAHLPDCEDCREAVAAFLETAAALALDAGAPAPPPGLRGRILEQARAEGPATVVPLRRRVPVASVAAALAACAALGLGIWAAHLHGSLDRERAASRALTALLAEPGTQRYDMPTGASLVRAADGQAVLVVSKVGAAPSGKTYEAWVIPQGRPPLAAGTFGGRGVAQLTRNVPRGATVAVTLEDAGGAAQPTTPVLMHTVVT